MNHLDPLQLELQGTSLIEASAGTGKTYTLATLYLRLLLERELVVSEILVVTYTRAATAELRDRIRTRIVLAIDAFEADDAKGDASMDALLARFASGAPRRGAIDRLTAALTGFDEAAILTIHGFCQGVLHENAFECGAGFDVELLIDQSALLEEIVGDYWARTTAHEPELFVRYLIDNKTDIRKLIHLVGRAGAEKPVRLIPNSQPVAVERLDELAQNWLEAFAEVKIAWERSGVEVISLLHAAATDGDLHKASYTPRKIEELWAEQMERILSDSSPLARDWCNALERFTPERLAEKTNKKGTTPRHSFFDVCARSSETYRELIEHLRERNIEFERELIQTVALQSRERKDRKGQQSYEDLLLQVAEALEPPGGRLLAARLRRQYRAALVDEFQDTDRLQYGILRNIWHREDHDPAVDDPSPPALFLIGDPKQAIYGFRGADVFAYLKAKRDAGERCFTLDTNWRSDPSMVEAVNRLFKRSASPFRLEGIPFEEIEPRPGARDLFARSETSAGKSAALEITFLSRIDEEKPMTKGSSQDEVPRRVAADIANLIRGDARIEGRRVRPDDVAILCRTNAQTETMCQALRRIDVPAAILGSASVFDAPEAREIERVLDAVAEPGSVGRVRAALTSGIFGVSGEELEALASDEEAWEQRLLQFRRWQEDWRERGFIHMFHQLFREGRVHGRLLALEGGERRLTNFLHLAELLERAVLTDHLGPSGLVDWLSRMRGDRSVRDNAIGDAGELRLESDDDAVKVVTIHKSKGLEYPIVYCPFLWEGSELRAEEKTWVRFHDPNRDDQIVLDLGSDQRDEHEKRAREESHAESVRFLYVALTRSKHRCSIVWGNFRQAESSPLVQLLHPGVEPKAFKKLGDDEMRGEIGELVDNSQGSIVLRELAEQPVLAEKRMAKSRALTRASATRKISTTWRHSSFSALTASQHGDLRSLPRTSEEGRDYDAVSQASALGQRAEIESPVPLNSFPAGAAAGTLLHSILEHLDFERPAREQRRDIVAETLEAQGFESHWRDPLCSALDRIVTTAWSESGPRLADLPRSKRLDELEFMFPVADRGAGGAEGNANRAMTVADLSNVFALHAENEFQRDYARRLAQLRFDPLAGYLKGYVDLIFEWRGRFYIVDYKSNHLGPSSADYDAAGLEVPMSEHHYVLQYHLYTVALDRYLALRLEGYDYERHFGGVYYLFLRGMDPDHPIGRGVYHHRPTGECILALSDALARPGGDSP